MRLLAFILGLATLASASSAIQAQTAPGPRTRQQPCPTRRSAAAEYSRGRLAQDITAVETYRPEYPFWQYIFTIPDGRIAFGSAQDGRLLATFPTAGDWARDAVWEEQALLRLPERPHAAQAAERAPRRAGPTARRRSRVRSSTTRLAGSSSCRTRSATAASSDEWGAIYERFGVPAEIGLAQAILESGLDGRARSRARRARLLPVPQPELGVPEQADAAS